MNTEVIHNEFTLHNCITDAAQYIRYWPQAVFVQQPATDLLHRLKKTKLTSVGEGGKNIFLEAVHMYQNSGGGAGVLIFRRRCRCITRVEAVQAYGGGACVLEFWRRCRCIKILAVLQFLFVVQMRWTSTASWSTWPTQCVSFIIFPHTEVVTWCPGGCRPSVR